MKVSFGDGTPFPDDAFKTYKKIRDEINVNIRWKQGDILLLNNLAVQHDRRPGKPPRVILAFIVQVNSMLWCSTGLEAWKASPHHFSFQ
ncbi:hypothetical protein AMTRI_Chr11g100920 [Amborella trichopoda]